MPAEADYFEPPPKPPTITFSLDSEDGREIMSQFWNSNFIELKGSFFVMGSVSFVAGQSGEIVLIPITR
jgi:hypothetical protein